MTTPGDGSADEVRALLTMLTGWAQRAVPAPASGHGGPECEWCPLCQLASALRGEHPELTERLTEMAAAVATAIRAVLDSAARATPGGRAGVPPTSSAAPSDSKPRPRPAPRPRVERIDLDDVPDTDGRT